MPDGCFRTVVRGLYFPFSRMPIGQRGWFGAGRSVPLGGAAMQVSERSLFDDEDPGPTADTPSCEWTGEPVDYSACIDELVRFSA